LGDVRRDIDEALASRGNFSRKPGNKGGNYHVNRNVGELRKEFRERELVSKGTSDLTCVRFRTTRYTDFIDEFYAKLTTPSFEK
jgi:hypothetical protein